jgi:RNA polymerase sigma-70 factor (ECF subfamily)
MVLTSSGSDEALWVLSRDGDGRAFAGLYDRYRDRLFRAALRSTATTADAEDVVAATFLELWRRRNDARLVNGSLLPWLLTVLLNVSRNVARFRRRHSAFLQRLPAPSAVRSAEEVAIAELVRMEKQRQSTRLMQALPPADAQIFELALVEELPLATVAEVLGISVDAAKKRLSRARRRARELTQPTTPVVVAHPEETRS